MPSFRKANCSPRHCLRPQPMGHAPLCLFPSPTRPPAPSPQIEDLFYKYGRIRDISIRTRKTPAFAYVEFEDPRDAEDAVYGRDGYDFGGYRLKVELAKEDRRGYGPPGGYGGPPGRNNFPPSRKTRYRVIVENLPDTASWQDLKDHMRDGGDVTYVDVFKDRQGTYGLVDYSSFEDMDRAIRRLDDTKVKPPPLRPSALRSCRVFESSGEEAASPRCSRGSLRRGVIPWWEVPPHFTPCCSSAPALTDSSPSSQFKNPYDSTYIRVREYRSPSEERAERRRSRSRGAGRSRSPEDRGR